MKYLVGIDNGGTFSKAAVFDENGKQLSVASAGTVTIAPKPGYTEREMGQLWQVNVKVIREAILKSGVNTADIVGVSFSGHGKGLYLVGDEGQPVYNGILSTDSRAWKFVKTWYADGTAGRVYQKTYQEILVMQPVALLAWFKEHEPEVLHKTRYIFAVKDYIRYRLTGEAFAEYTDFTGANLVNLNTGNYDRELLEWFGIGDLYDKLPPLRKSSDICGVITKEASEETMLPQGIPVAAGMFDVDACGIASGLSDENQMCMVAGTWSINEFISRHPVINGSISLNSMFCIPGYYLIEESSPTSAGNMEWFVRNLMDCELERAEDEHESIYNLANKWVESIHPSDNDLIFLPFLNGSSEDPLAKGTLIGLTMYHTKQHILQAVYEGIVFSHLTHVKKLLLNHKIPESIRLSGGAAKSSVWVQMFADALQIPIDTVQDKELGAQGAAMAAGIAAGLYKDYREAVSRMVHITDRVMPRPEYKNIYEKKYAAYRGVIEALGKGKAWQYFKSEV